MRFSSNGSKSLSVLLSAVLAWNGGGAAFARAEQAEEPCLLLKVVSPRIPETTAREKMDPLPELLAETLRVRWIPAGLPRHAPGEDADTLPEPDAAALDELSGILADASRLMDAMETGEAALRLAEAESFSRRYRFGEAVRPFLAETFFRQGILFLWDGNSAECVERFARSRALRPGFSPDPALYSPTVQEAWTRAAERPVRPAELLVQSIPPGAEIYLEGNLAGTTPGRIQPDGIGPVRILVAKEGYLPEERVGQWLPGDSGLMEITLAADPASGLPDLLASDPGGEGAGRRLREISTRAGANRIAVLLFDVQEGKETLRVLSMGRGDRTAAVLGEMAWPEGEDGIEQVARKAAEMLASAGWPAKTAVTREKRPWYHTWWLWVVLVGVAAGVAAAGSGGGGGDSGSSSGTVGVIF
ncbi:MAG TPA: hypothetical protein DD658_08270 [Deltaproteobacteria bacterium]|nr:hypothetical protein [Deltaproteobacteria bacterium]